MSKKIRISINLIVEDPEALVREIANFYEAVIMLICKEELWKNEKRKFYLVNLIEKVM